MVAGGGGDSATRLRFELGATRSRAAFPAISPVRQHRMRACIAIRFTHTLRTLAGLRIKLAACTANVMRQPIQDVRRAAVVDVASQILLLRIL